MQSLLQQLLTAEMKATFSRDLITSDRLLSREGLDLGEFTQARIEKGEVGVAFLWDFNALGYREQFVENNPDADFTVFIPSEASIQTGYCYNYQQIFKASGVLRLLRENTF